MVNWCGREYLRCYYNLAHVRGHAFIEQVLFRDEAKQEMKRCFNASSIVVMKNVVISLPLAASCPEDTVSNMLYRV